MCSSTLFANFVRFLNQTLFRRKNQAKRKRWFKLDTGLCFRNFPGSNAGHKEPNPSGQQLVNDDPRSVLVLSAEAVEFKESLALVAEYSGKEETSIVFNDYSLLIPQDENYCSILGTPGEFDEDDMWNAIDLNSVYEGFGETVQYERNEYVIDESDDNEVTGFRPGGKTLTLLKRRWLQLGIPMDMIEEREEQIEREEVMLVFVEYSVSL
jgi:hypothetical protein